MKTGFMTRDREFYRTFIELALALMLQQMVVLSVNLADNVMLGSYSETALSGVAAVNQLQFILQMAVNGITNSMIIVASQYWGQKKIPQMKQLISYAIWLNVFFAVLLFVIVTASPVMVMHFFTEDEAIIREGIGYLNIVKFSYLFFVLSSVLLGSMRLIKKVKIAFVTSIIALVINCSINFALIKGHFGLPALGARGAAIGTLTARIVEFLIVVYYVFRMDDVLQIRFKEIVKAKMDLFATYIQVLLPLFADSMLWGFNTAMQTVILGHMSSSAIAAHSISATVFLFLKVNAVGASSAASVIVGKTIGEGRIDKVKEYVRTLQVLFIGIGICIMGIMLAIRYPLLSVYALVDETRRMAEIFILIDAVVLLITSYQMPMNVGVICGGGDSRFLMWLDVVSVWMVGIPLSLIAAFVLKLSPVWVMVMLNMDQIVKCLPAFYYGNSFKWIKILTQD